MSDLGHDITEKELKKVEDLISREYRQAAQELTAKMEKHYADFDRKDKEMVENMKAGKITATEYYNWRVGQLAIGKRWESVRDSMTETLVNADKVAADIIRGNSIKAYGENMNYGTYEVEHGSKINTGFSLYDESTVRNLLKDDPKIIPLPKVDIPKDELWNRQKLTSAVTQGILQGESMSGIAKRLSEVAAMDSRAAIRNARTYTTAAENKGRIDSYERANDLGIETKKKWIATLDDRTRAEHRHLDNMVVGNDEDFEVDGYSISYPGDPAAEPEMIYNCRCTLVAEIANYDYNDSRNDERLGDMSYEEWKHAKDEESEEEAPVIEIPEINFVRYTGDDVKLVSAMYEDQVQGLSSQEKSGIRRYVGDTKSTQYEYEKINGYLRHGGKISKANEDAISAIDSAISKFEVKEPFTARRGINLDTFNSVLPGINDSMSVETLRDALVGVEFTDKGYMSSSWNVWGGFSRDAYIEIDVPAGKGIGCMVGNLPRDTKVTENEFIFGRDSHVEIYAVDEDKYGRLIIHSRYVR